MHVNTLTRLPLLFGLATALAWFSLTLPAHGAESIELTGTVVAVYDGVLEVELDNGRRVLAQPPESAPAPDICERISATAQPMADIYQLMDLQTEPQN